MRYLGSLLMRTDEVVLCLFAGDADAVRAAAERAHVPFERIVVAERSSWPAPERERAPVTRRPDGARANPAARVLGRTRPTASTPTQGGSSCTVFVSARARLLLPALCAAALLAIVCSGVSSASGTSVSNAKLGGTWAGSYSGSYAGTFTIHWRQASSGALTGTIALSRPHGTYGISGNVRGFAITFGAVGAGATYTGSVSGLQDVRPLQDRRRRERPLERAQDVLRTCSARKSEPPARTRGAGGSCRPRSGARETRTPDLLGAIQALSQLSYSPGDARL